MQAARFFRAAIGAATIGAGPWAMAGLGPAGAAVPAAAPAVASGCVAVKGTGPGYNVTVGLAQNGETVCLTVGEKVLVWLSTSVSSKVRWAPPRVSPPGILVPAALTLMLPRNVTAENFLAERAGLVQVSSERRACPPPTPGSASCGAILGWQVRLLVRAVARPIG
ncbi:MAG TPA: hypothetical protein VK425_05980 [Acidimicrobiales bacterium]|nr:hypothetical protein [Acidimicrobiales bacterium]